MRTPTVAVLLALLASSSVPASEPSSTSFEVKAHAFNAGGQPPASTSASFGVRLGAIGDGAASLAIASASFSVGGGFPASFPPPGEVSSLVFTNHETLEWDPERSAAAYNLYRELVTSITPNFGACEQSELPSETATDTDVPAADTTFFYLVTAKNCLDEEGTKGFQSNGIERANPAPCP